MSLSRWGYSIVAVFFFVGGAQPDEVNIPRSLDPRIQIELIAAEPDIMTPTGLTVDDRGRVFVIESHTHFRPEDYEGPPADRILLFQDADGDGRVERTGVFFEGTTYTMNIGAYHDGSFYVATRNEIFRLEDEDEDGQADKKTTIVHLETEGNYPHNGLSGFAFDFAGNIYFTMGENLGAAYELIGSDGDKLTGGGEGGGVYRCKPDGSDVVRLATGLWNPFHLAFDAYERLFCIENDPDWRPPCRLLHIVPGGDYGFHFRNGRRGTHPFTSWFGELPGTLGPVAGTGEAPSGILSYDSDGLPEEYRGTLLTTSWGYHAIERFRLERNGASFKSVPETIIKGDEHFRPVGIALAPDGSIYVSDWVDASYDLHKLGRLWRISTVAPTTSAPRDHSIHSPHRPTSERAARDMLKSAEGLAELRRLLKEEPSPEVRAVAVRALATRGNEENRAISKSLEDPSEDVREVAIALRKESTNPAAVVGSKPLLAATFRRVDQANWLEIAKSNYPLIFLGDEDPFVRQAVREAILPRELNPSEQLTPDVFQASSIYVDSTTAIRVRVEAALVLRLRGQNVVKDVGDILPHLLADGDPQVRLIGIQWIGESRLEEFEPALRQGLVDGTLGGELFEATLAALHVLSSPDVKPADYEEHREEILAALLQEENPPAAVLIGALRALPANHEGLGARRLGQLVHHADPMVRIEALRTLRGLSPSEKDPILAEFMSDDLNRRLFAEAIAGLTAESFESREVLVARASGVIWNKAVQQESIRTLKGATLADDQKRRIREASELDPESKQLTARLLGEKFVGDNRPPKEDLDAWAKWAAGGDAEAGERLFYHPQGPKCFVCHRLRGRGGSTGPDLSMIGQSTPQRIMESILFPSREMAPHYVTWRIIRNDGSSFVGVMKTEEGSGRQVYVDAEGNEIKIHRDEMEFRQPEKTSIMPDGLVDMLTDGEIRDLFAMLTQCK